MAVGNFGEVARLISYRHLRHQARPSANHRREAAILPFRHRRRRKRNRSRTRFIGALRRNVRHVVNQAIIIFGKIVIGADTERPA